MTTDSIFVLVCNFPEKMEFSPQTLGQLPAASQEIVSVLVSPAKTCRQGMPGRMSDHQSGLVNYLDNFL